MTNDSQTGAHNLARLILKLQPAHMTCERFARILLQLSVDLVTVELDQDEADVVFHQAAVPIVRAVAQLRGSCVPLPQLTATTGPPESNGSLS